MLAWRFRIDTPLTLSLPRSLTASLHLTGLSPSSPRSEQLLYLSAMMSRRRHDLYDPKREQRYTAPHETYRNSKHLIHCTYRNQRPIGRSGGCKISQDAVQEPSGPSGVRAAEPEHSQALASIGKLGQAGPREPRDLFRRCRHSSTASSNSDPGLGFWPNRCRRSRACGPGQRAAWAQPAQAGTEHVCARHRPRTETGQPDYFGRVSNGPVSGTSA